MKVRMKALAIGADFRYEPNKVYDIDDMPAEEMISAGFAVYADDKERKTEVHNADSESASVKRGVKSGKRKSVSKDT